MMVQPSDLPNSDLPLVWPYFPHASDGKGKERIHNYFGSLEKLLPDKQITVCDIKTDFIEHMKKQNLNALYCDINNLPFIGKSFDTIVAGELLEHLENPGQGLNELCRVARKKVIITLPIMIYDDWHLWDINCEIVDSFLIIEFIRK